jgi:hypothetical protein
MEPSAFGAGLVGAIGTTAFFAFCAFAVWIDYRKKKEDREAAHLERMKALELGQTLPDGEIERAKAYASAAWAAGLVGLLVPLAVVGLTVAGTIVAVLNTGPSQNITIPLIVAWSIAAVLVLVAVVRSLSVIRQLPRPAVESRPAVSDKQPVASSPGFRAERMEL